MRLFHLFVVGCLVTTGCSKHTGIGIDHLVPPESLAWIGAYTGAPAPGDVILDLVRIDHTVSGSVLFGSGAAGALRVAGTMSADSLFLSLDPTYSSSPSDLSLRAGVLSDGSLAGTLSYIPDGLDATFASRVLERRGITLNASLQNALLTVIAMEYDGTLLWLSTPADGYALVTPDGTYVRSVTVAHDPGGTWTSTALMFDGTEMWGTYPITVTGPGGSQNVADVLGFDSSGRTGDSLRVGHRPVGLAHDGTSGWSLRNDPAALIRFDAAGAVQDSIHLQIPDAVFLDFDGSHFWTLGWHLRRLYEVDIDGTVLAMRDLPSHDPAALPSGLAVEGTHVWYSEGSIGGGGWLDRMTPY